MEKKSFFTAPSFGEIRMRGISRELFYVATDVAEMLEYSSPSKAVVDICKNVKTIDGELCINEADFLRLVLFSNSKKAVEYRDYLVNEILPFTEYPLDEEIKTEKFVACFGEPFVDYWIRGGVWDRCVSSGGVWVENEYSSYSMNDTDTNRSRGYKRFKENLSDLATAMGYDAEFSGKRGSVYVTLTKKS